MLRKWLPIVIATALIVATAVPTAMSGERPKVAVVLGGGAARGLSHVGLLQALEEAGIPIDYVVGTSMGSIVAGLYSSGLSTANIAHIVTEVDFTELFLPSWPPQGGFIQTDRFEKFLDVLLRHQHIEQGEVPFVSVITNVVTGEELALDTGPYSRGILASMSIPGMFPPVVIDGAYYVDGGMKSPVPVYAAQKLGADFIIAVDVRRELETIDHANVLTNVQLSLFFILDANTAEQLRFADITIVPAVETESYMDYDRAPHFIAAGYNAARQQLPQIRDALLALDANFPFGAQPPVAGMGHEELQMLLHDALSAAADMQLAGGPPWRVALEARPGEGRFDVTVGTQVATLGQATPVSVTYNASLGRSQTAGVHVGSCGTGCAGLFARRYKGEARWQWGLAGEGQLARTLRYGAQWEAAEGDPQWNVRLSVPPPAYVLSGEMEMTLRLGQDPRGEHGPADGRLQGDVLVRKYFPGEKRDVLDLMRISTNWYAGVGVRATVDEAATLWQPVLEGGILWEGRLFGLYPMRTRLGATYAGARDPWTIRLSFGD